MASLIFRWGGSVKPVVGAIASAWRWLRANAAPVTVLVSILGLVVTTGLLRPCTTNPAVSRVDLSSRPPLQQATSADYDSAVTSASAAPVPSTVTTVSVAVLPFEDRSASPIHNASERARAQIEAKLSREAAIIVLDREHVDSTVEEVVHGRLFGDLRTAPQLGRRLGAQILVLGTVHRIVPRVIEGEAYGVYARRTVVEVTVEIQVIAVETGRKQTIQQTGSAESYRTSTAGESSDHLVTEALSNATNGIDLERAIATLAADLR